MKSGRLLLCAVCSLLAAGMRAAPASAEGEWGENPFLIERNTPRAPELPENPGKQEVQLQGILWDPEAPTAIINNRVVAVGDQVDRWEVMEIRKDRVFLSDGTSTRELQS